MLVEEIWGSAAGNDGDIIARAVTGRRSVGSAFVCFGDRAGQGVRASRSERDKEEDTAGNAAERRLSPEPRLLSLILESSAEMSDGSDSEKDAVGCGGNAFDRAVERRLSLGSRSLFALIGLGGVGAILCRVRDRGAEPSHSLGD